MRVIELLCLYKAFVIFDLLPCMAFTISDKKINSLKTVRLKKDSKNFSYVRDINISHINECSQSSKGQRQFLA